jgi:hypothetical protein
MKRFTEWRLFDFAGMKNPRNFHHGGFRDYHHFGRPSASQPVPQGQFSAARDGQESGIRNETDCIEMPNVENGIHCATLFAVRVKFPCYIRNHTKPNSLVYFFIFSGFDLYVVFSTFITTVR